jgi:hypothetical protein
MLEISVHDGFWDYGKAAYHAESMWWNKGVHLMSRRRKRKRNELGSHNPFWGKPSMT